MKKFLSIVLSLAMIISTMGTVVFAEATELPEAVDGLITLVEDVVTSAGVVIPEDATVVLDLNGYNIIGETGAIVNNGNLTIQDSVGTGKVYTTDVSKQGRAAVVNNGTMIIEGGWFGDSNNDTTDRNAINRGNALKNYGNVTINGGYFTNVSNQYISAAAYAYAINNISGLVTINNATVYGDINGLIYAEDKVVVNGGSFTLGRPNEENNLWYLAYGDVEIKGGTWTRAYKVPSWNTGNPTMNGDVQVSGGTFWDVANDTVLELPEENISDGCIVDENGKIVAIVAEVDGVSYTSLTDAFNALAKAANPVINILADVTIADKWDCRYTGTKTTVPVTVNGNGHTLKFTGEINDGGNHHAVFRVEAEATFRNLTVDMSEATASNNRFRVISSKDSDLTVEDCTFIGSTTYTNTRAIIFGESAGHNDAEITISGCTFVNFTRGVTDNENAKDVASVTVTDSEFTNASIHVSASEEVTITDNNMNGGYINVTSYTESPEQSLVVTVTGNVLDEDYVNAILKGTIVDIQDGFKAPTPVAEVNGKKYADLQKAINAAADGETITIIENVALAAQNANPALKPAYNRESYAGLIIPDDKTLTIDLNGKTISYVDVYVDCDNLMVINLGNLTINDSVGGGKMTYKPVAGNKTYTYFYSTIFNCGTLTINGGTIENTAEAETDVTNAVDNHSRLSHEYDNDCILIVNGGTLKGAYYYAIRQYTHYYEGVQNRVTINDGTIAGGIYMQHGDSWYYADASKNRLNVDGYLTINGGEFIAVEDDFNTIKSRLYNPDNDVWGLEINGGNFNNATVQLLVQRGVYYANGVSGATVPAESAGTRNAEWLEEKGGFITGGSFESLGDENDATKYLEGFLAEGLIFADNGAGFSVLTDDTLADAIEVVFEDVTDENAEGEKTYNINLVATNNEIINRLNSGDLTFIFDPEDGKSVDFEIIDIANDNISVAPVDNSKYRYEFHFDTKTGVENDTANTITIAQVKFEGYGKFSFMIDETAVDEKGNKTNAVHTTKLSDNIVDTFVVDGGEGVGELIINNAAENDDNDDDYGFIDEAEITVPARTLTINIDFPNAVVNNVAAYQDMTVTIVGRKVDIKRELGTDGYAYKFTEKLPYNTPYTVTVKGAGYRTARYTVTMTEDKTLNFWNNVKDIENAKAIEDKGTVKVTKNFLAGDIVKDNNINIYDLSAVVSYFNTTNDTSAYSDYAKYDLNRDGVINSKDVAYVLVSWGE